MTIAKAPDSIFWCFLKAIINFLTKSNQLSPILYRITLTTSLFRISRHSLILRINCVFFILIHKRPLHFYRYSMLDLSPVIVENRINLVLNLIQFMLLIIHIRLHCSQLLVLLLIQLRLPVILNNNIIILLIASILIIVNLSTLFHWINDIKYLNPNHFNRINDIYFFSSIFDSIMTLINHFFSILFMSFSWHLPTMSSPNKGPLSN